MTGADAYADWDAAYVLGALSSEERSAYETHLADCHACRGAVAELAGVPGLLAKLPPGEVLAMDIDEDELPEAPASLMPVLPAPVTVLRRRRWLVPAAAAAAALAVGGAGGYAVSAARHHESYPPTIVSAQTRLAFSDVVPSAMTAVLDIVPTATGTELKVECQYAEVTSGPGYQDTGAAWAQYAIWVVDRDGHATQVTSWTAKPDKVMHPSGTSRLTRAQIGSVQIRRVDTGRTVMQTAVA